MIEGPSLARREVSYLIALPWATLVCGYCAILLPHAGSDRRRGSRAARSRSGDCFHRVDFSRSLSLHRHSATVQPANVRRHISDHALLRWRSEEHTSELQSRLHLVCRLLLEKKKK